MTLFGEMHQKHPKSNIRWILSAPERFSVSPKMILSVLSEAIKVQLQKDLKWDLVKSVSALLETLWAQFQKNLETISRRITIW